MMLPLSRSLSCFKDGYTFHQEHPFLHLRNRYRIELCVDPHVLYSCEPSLEANLSRGHYWAVGPSRARAAILLPYGSWAVLQNLPHMPRLRVRRKFSLLSHAFAKHFKMSAHSYQHSEWSGTDFLKQVLLIHGGVWVFFPGGWWGWD